MKDIQAVYMYNLYHNSNDTNDIQKHTINSCFYARGHVPRLCSARRQVLRADALVYI